MVAFPYRALAKFLFAVRKLMDDQKGKVVLTGTLTRRKKQWDVEENIVNKTIILMSTRFLYIHHKLSTVT